MGSRHVYVIMFWGLLNNRLQLIVCNQPFLWVQGLIDQKEMQILVGQTNRLLTY